MQGRANPDEWVSYKISHHIFLKSKYNCCIILQRASMFIEELKSSSCFSWHNK